MGIKRQFSREFKLSVLKELETKSGERVSTSENYLIEPEKRKKLK